MVVKEHALYIPRDFPEKGFRFRLRNLFCDVAVRGIDCIQCCHMTVMWLICKIQMYFCGSVCGAIHISCTSTPADHFSLKTTTLKKASIPYVYGSRGWPLHNEKKWTCKKENWTETEKNARVYFIFFFISFYYFFVALNNRNVLQRSGSASILCD